MNKADNALFKSANRTIRKLREARAAIYARQLGLQPWQITEAQLDAPVRDVLGA